MFFSRMLTLFLNLPNLDYFKMLIVVDYQVLMKIIMIIMKIMMMIMKIMMMIMNCLN